jgi:hypothetical protein
LTKYFAGNSPGKSNKKGGAKPSKSPSRGFNETAGNTFKAS